MRLEPRGYLILAAVASAAMLAAAHAFERIGGYPPCALCLRQREVYWIALSAALPGLFVLRREADAPRLLPLLLAVVFLVGGGVAGFHAGVEWKWWEAPASCSGAGPASAASMEALLRGESVRFVRCDEVAWSLFGLSMAGWNALASLALAGLGVIAAAGASFSRTREAVDA